MERRAIFFEPFLPKGLRQYLSIPFSILVYTNVDFNPKQIDAIFINSLRSMIPLPFMSIFLLISHITKTSSSLCFKVEDANSGLMIINLFILEDIGES